MRYYAYGCSSLVRLNLQGDVGWFDDNNISWGVPSGRLNYLYAYCDVAYLNNWRALTATDKTLYLNYIRSSSYVKEIILCVIMLMVVVV